MTPDQLTLLRGVLLSGGDGLRHLTHWCETGDLDLVDADSHKVLPLLFRTLSKRDLAPRPMDLLRGIYRKSWYRNQQHVAATTKAIELLDDAEVAHTFVAGLPLALTAYGDLGARMLHVARLIVPPGDVARTVDMLSRNGFSVRRPAQEYGWGIPTVLSTPEGGALDVRGAVFGPGWSNAPDGELRIRLVPLNVNGFHTATLDATDAVVEAATAAASTRESWLQGLVDVALLARRTDLTVDWPQVSARYGGTPMSVPLHEALTALIEQVELPLSEGAAHWHREYKSHVADRLRFWTHRNGRRLLRLAPWYRRGIRAQGREGNSPSFAAFAAAVYGIESRADAMRRVKQRMTSWRS